MSRSFPDHFLWGTSTAAHQVEGGNHNNDWWTWEQQGHIKTGDSAAVACDHWNRFDEDVKLLSELGTNAHRLSIEWSRVEPEPGRFDQEVIDHYRAVLTNLREHDIATVVTLHHFTSPAWFVAQGGWPNRRAVSRWLPFVRRISVELGDLVSFWCTINEPSIYAYQGWMTGEFPPGKTGDVLGMFRVLAHLRRAHESAYAELKKLTPDVPVGLAQHKWLMVPKTSRWLDRIAARVADAAMSRWPDGPRLRRVVDSAGDYIGLNHYSGSAVSFSLRHPGEAFIHRTNPPGLPVSDFDWVIHPPWLGLALEDLRSAGKPIYITENGVATADDTLRQEFLPAMLNEVWKAIEQGVDVRGYFHWSSMDNIEWAHGYSMRFGLIAVDRDSLRRTVKPSGRTYAQIARANSIPEQGTEADQSA
ncbi:glycoside hydrolase family 1 protein [Flindersiella endophytica]